MCVEYYKVIRTLFFFFFFNNKTVLCKICGLHALFVLKKLTNLGFIVVLDIISSSSLHLSNGQSCMSNEGNCAL